MMTGSEQSPGPWRPLSARGGLSSSSEYDDLSEGIPHWLDPSLIEWLRARTFRNLGVVRRAERQLRASLGSNSGWRAEDLALRYWDGATDDERLDLVDFLAKDLETQRTAFQGEMNTAAVRGCEMALVDLTEMLAEAGSVWTVALEPTRGLVRRLGETTQDQVRATVERGGDAGALLKKAWHACHKVRPDYASAYRDAVLAVEAAALPILIRNDPSGTLGKAISHLDDTLARWTVAGLDARGPTKQRDLASHVADALGQPGTTCHQNQDPTPFVWHAAADEILKKVRRGRTTLAQVK